jgi:glutamate-ammonia-ligase adenylyltransferase
MPSTPSRQFALVDRLERLLDSWCAQHPVNQVRLAPVLPALVSEAACAPDPDATLQSALDLLGRMAEWPRYVTTLAADLSAVRRLVALISASPWLAQLLTARPALTDELLPGRYAAHPPGPLALRQSLRDMLRRCSDDESSRWLALRNFKHSCLLHILSLDLEGALPLGEVSAALSDLADVLLATVLDEVGARLSVTGGIGCPIGIVAYGKLGSREMSYASDTDIVFLHDDDPDVSAIDLTRVATTVNQWLTAPTPAGTLYETDFRLRPYGQSGLLITSLSAFRDYQLNAAWTWEHQALTRARFIAGAPQLADGFNRVRREALLRPRDAEQLHGDVLDMRARILASHQRAAVGRGQTSFDVKHSRGGVIDVEFIVQFLILRHAHTHPSLTEVGNNVVALSTAASLGLVPVGLARASAEAYAAYRLWMHRARLRGCEIVEVPMQDATLHQAVVKELWAHVFAETALEAEGAHA